jgi:hypothetical protein
MIQGLPVPCFRFFYGSVIRRYFQAESIQNYCGEQYDYFNLFHNFDYSTGILNYSIFYIKSKAGKGLACKCRKIILFSAIILPLVFNTCKKKDNPASEVQSLEQSVALNNDEEIKYSATLSNVDKARLNVQIGGWNIPENCDKVDVSYYYSTKDKIKGNYLKYVRLLEFRIENGTPILI